MDKLTLHSSMDLCGMQGIGGLRLVVENIETLKWVQVINLTKQR